MSIDDHLTDYEEEPEPRPRDEVIDEAKAVLLRPPTASKIG
jgi:hypothetical protein